MARVASSSNCISHNIFLVLLFLHPSRISPFHLWHCLGLFYRIFLLYLLRLPCHLYLVVLEQHRNEWRIRVPQTTHQNHANKYLPNLGKSNQIWIVITHFRLIMHQTEFGLLSYQSENCNCNPNLVWFNKIQRWFLWVQLFLPHTAEKKLLVKNDIKVVWSVPKECLVAWNYFKLGRNFAIQFNKHDIYFMCYEP